MQQLFSKHGCFRLVKVFSFVLILGTAAAHPAHAQLVFDTPSVDFGKIEVDSSSPTIVVDLRNTGNQPLTVSCAGGAVSPTQFSGALACMGQTLNPGETCPFSFTFKPVATGALSGSSSLTCNSVALNVNLAGEGVLPKLVLATPTIDFGPVLVDTTSPSIAVELINKGASPVVMSCAGGIPSESQFSAVQACVGKTLEPDDSCLYHYDFTPDAEGDFSGNGSVSCNGLTHSVELLGEGRLPALVMDKPAVDFGTVEVNDTSPTVLVELRNQGPDPVAISCSAGSASQPFDDGRDCSNSTLNAGDTCLWNFRFGPGVPGEATDTSNFICNGVALSVALRGEGVNTLPATGLSFDTPLVDFGKIEVGSISPTIVVDLRNTGSQPMTVSCDGGAVSPTQFSGPLACQGQVLNPGETCPFYFTFKPTATGILSGDASPICNMIQLHVNLTGEGVLPKLVLATPSIDFGPVLVDTTSPSIAVELINKGASPVVMSCSGGIPSESQFNVVQACAGKTLAPGDSCLYHYDFTPDAEGDFSGNGEVNCNDVTHSVELLGEGRLPALVMDKPAVDFGTVELGTTSATVFVELRNHGPEPVTLSCSGGTIDEAQPFSGAQSCHGSSLAVGETCTWHFSFTPDALGEINGGNSFICNGVSLGVALRGAGIREFIFADSFE